MSGKVVHFEIPFENGDRARKFYGQTFGWQLVPVPEMGYTMAMTGPTDPSRAPRSGFHKRGHVRAQRGVPRQGTEHRDRRAERG